MTRSEKDLLDALDLFINELRGYIVSLLSKNFQVEWSERFRDALSPVQQMNWDKSINEKISPIDLIDFQYLKSFSIKYKTLFQPQFGKKSNSLPTWFGEIADVRNHLTHFTALKESDAIKGWIHMITIAEILKIGELEAKLYQIHKGEIIDTHFKKNEKEIFQEYSEKQHKEKFDETPLSVREEKIVIVATTELRETRISETPNQGIANIDTKLKEPLRANEFQSFKNGEEQKANIGVTRTDQIRKKSRLKITPEKLQKDFSMVKGFKWIKLNGTKIIINKILSKIIIDFNSGTITEKYSFKRDRTVNYNNVINDFLTDHSSSRHLAKPDFFNRHKFTILQLRKSYLTSDFLIITIRIKHHQIIYEFTKTIYNYVLFHELTNGLSHKKALLSCKAETDILYLFFSFLASYICELNIEKFKERNDFDFKVNNLRNSDYNPDDINLRVTLDDFN